MANNRHKPPPYKLIDQGNVKGITIGDWVITAVTGPILNSEKLEELEKRIDAPTLPEMVFGENIVSFEYGPSGFTLRYTAEDYLRDWSAHCKDETSIISVSFAEGWVNERKERVKNLPQKKYDWTFTPKNCTGIIKKRDSEGNLVDDKTLDNVVRDDKIGIDYEILKGRDPIIFFSEVILFEDELADSGSSNLTVKLRVMPQCFFALVRFWMRVDDVMFRCCDTRIFHKFGEKHIVREVSKREADFEYLKPVLPQDRSEHGNQMKIYDLLPVRSCFTEKICI